MTVDPTVAQDAAAASTVPGDALPPEAIVANLAQKLRDNPMLLEPSLAIINACEQDAEEEALLAAVHADLAARGKLPVQPLSAVLRMLAAAGALTESLTVDGAPYAGTLEDAFDDPGLPDDAAVAIYARATEAGRLAARSLAPEQRAAALFAEHPQHARALLLTLRLCDGGSQPTAALQEALDAEGLLNRDPRTNIPQLYPSLFANLLKDAGCLAWDRAWVTTDLGRAVLAGHTVSAG